MKKTVLILSLLLMTVVLASCGNSSDWPLTEAQQAESYGMSVAEFKEQKNAAAAMNMTIEDHLKMSDTSGGMDHSSMDMSDDSSMIEDDSEEKMIMPEWAHKMPDGSIMLADGTTMSGNHTMEDGTVMKDSEMHMEMMHDGENIEEHGSDKHGDHE